MKIKKLGQVDAGNTGVEVAFSHRLGRSNVFSIPAIADNAKVSAREVVGNATLDDVQRSVSYPVGSIQIDLMSLMKTNTSEKDKKVQIICIVELLYVYFICSTFIVTAVSLQAFCRLQTDLLFYFFYFIKAAEFAEENADNYYIRDVAVLFTVRSEQYNIGGRVFGGLPHSDGVTREGVQIITFCLHYRFYCYIIMINMVI